MLGEVGDHVAGPPHVDPDRAGLEQPLHRLAVRIGDPLADRGVGDEDPDELLVATGRRPPVDLGDRGALGTDRLGEQVEADVDDPERGAEQGARTHRGDAPAGPPPRIEIAIPGSIVLVTQQTSLASLRMASNASGASAASVLEATISRRS